MPWISGLDGHSTLATKFQGGQTHLFIKGPVPLWWMQTASRECGFSSVILGMILFHWQGLKRTPAPISKREAEKWGITRNTRDSALKKLQQSQLISIEYTGKRKYPLLDLYSRKPSLQKLTEDR